MLKEKEFSLALPDGVSERLSTHCDVRGNGFPRMEGIGSAAFKRKARLREFGIAAGSPPARLAPPTRFPSPPPFRGTPKALEGELLIGPPRPGTRGKSLTPFTVPRTGPAGRLPAVYDSAFARQAKAARAAEQAGLPARLWRKGLSNMQWTMLGQLLTADDLTYLSPTEAVQAGYDFSGLDVIASYDDTCGNSGNVRWNGRSYGAVDTDAFYFNQCASNQAQSASMGNLFADPENPKPLVFEGTNNCVSWGPRGSFADWHLTFRHGRMIDRHGATGNITVSFQPEVAGRPAAWPELAPGAEWQTGWFPMRWSRRVSALSPHSDRGYEVGPKTRADGHSPVRPSPPPKWARERKYRDDGAPTRLGRYHGSKVEKLFHWMTEFDDVVDIAYDNLAQSVKDRYRCEGDLCKLNAIASNLDKMDWDKLGADLVKNEMEDQLVGRAHGVAQGRGQPHRRNLGLGQFR